MIKFWLKLNIRTKAIVIVFFAVIILSFIGWANYKQPPVITEDNSKFVDRITNRNPILSYPVSYSPNWEGRIMLTPLKIRELEYAASNNETCSGITNSMDVYYTPSFDSVMVINNKNLLKSASEKTSFENAVKIISGRTDFDQLNAELQSFRTYCSFFSLTLIDELENKFPNTDFSRSIFGIGLRQGEAESVADLGLYIYVYSIKDDYLIQLSRSLQGSFLFTQENWNLCKAKSLQSEQNACLKNIYSNDLSMVSKVENETNNLIEIFRISDGE